MKQSKLYALIFLLSLCTTFSAFANDKNPLILEHLIFSLESEEIYDVLSSEELAKRQITDEELIQKVKTALLSIYSEKKIKFGDFNVDKSGSEITVEGAAELYKNRIKISSIFTTGKKLLEVKGSFAPGTKMNGRNFKKISGGPKVQDWFPKELHKSVALDNISLSLDEETQKVSELAIALSTTDTWTMIEGGVLTMKKIQGGINIKNPTGSKSITASLSGGINISNTSIDVETTIGSSRDSWEFKGDLSDLSLTNLLKSVVGSTAGIPMPDGFVDVSIVKSSFTVALASKKFSLSGTGAINGTNLGDLQLLAESKGKKKGMGFMVGIAPSPDFKLAKIDNGLSIIDELGITNFGLVLSSDARATANLDVFERIGGTSEIGRGLNFIGAYDLRAAGLYDLIKVESLMLRTVISNKFSDMLLEASVNTEIPIGDIATFKKILFRLKPASMEFSMGGQMEVIIDGDKLLFTATMGVDVIDQAIFVEGSMDGMWNEPFGTKGLAVGDLWMKFGVSFRTTPIPLPEMGIAGKLKASNFEGDLLLVININNPTESAIDVGFNEISVKSILESFCDKQTLSHIPQELRNTILDVKLKDARLTVVPRPMTINKTSYDAGFRVKGDASMGNDLAAKLDINIGYDGIEASAGIKAISHPPYFELKGSRGKPDPSIEIVAKMSKDPKVAITGSATVLGLTAEADMMLNDQGFDLFVQGKIFDAFKASLEISGSRVIDGGSFRVAATMEQDFVEYFTKHASEEIDKATKETQDEITSAQKDVTEAQREVAKLQGEINNQKRVVQGERDRDLANLRKAEQSVANERVKVQRIQSNIDAAHNAVASIDRAVAAKDCWINDTGDTPFVSEAETVARGLASVDFFVEKGAERLAKMSEIAALEIAKGTADLALLAAQETVGLMHDIGKEVPLEMDPRVASIITAKEVAIGSMEAAKYIMEGGKIVGVGTLQATKYIIENGPLSVVNVTYAHFEGKLSATNGGSVTLHIKGTFADEPFDEKITFNFNNPLDEVVKFAESLL